MKFWGQFDVKISKLNLAPVTEFSYLKEFVDLKIRALINGLPFTFEGYKCDKIVITTVIRIIQLLANNDTKSQKIIEFYQKQITHLNTLIKMGKLKDINKHVIVTIDRHNGIRGDLIRTDDNLQN